MVASRARRRVEPSGRCSVAGTRVVGSGGVSCTEASSAMVVTRSAAWARSCGVANRTPCTCRSASASTLERVNVARRAATASTTTVAASLSIPSSRSAA